MGTNNIDNEDEELFVTITLEDDSEIECEVLTILKLKNRTILHYFMIMEKKMEKYLFIDILKTKMESQDLTILKHRKNLTWFQKCLTVLLKTENMTKLSRNNI